MSATSAVLNSRPASRVNRNAVLAVVAVARFMVILDSTVVNVALPTIRRDLGFSEQNLSWVLNAYTLMFGGFLLLGGRAADRLGRRRLFVAGIALFSGASLICGLSQSEGTLLVRAGRAGTGRRDGLPGGLVDHPHHGCDRDRAR
jgi:MFS family permease